MMSSPLTQYLSAGQVEHSWLTGPDPIVVALRALAALPLRAYLRTYHRLHIIGRQHLPREGSFVMVANHASHLDALCLLSAIPLSRLDRAFPAAAQDYFFAKHRRVALAAIFANAIPFGRKVHLRTSLELCRRLLGVPGNVLILFPEGTRTATGNLGLFRPGIGALLASTPVPVVPCAIRGSFGAWPKGACLPRPRRLQLVIGAPRVYAELPRCRDSNNRIAGELRAAVQDALCE